MTEVLISRRTLIKNLIGSAAYAAIPFKDSPRKSEALDNSTYPFRIIFEESPIASPEISNLINMSVNHASQFLRRFPSVNYKARREVKVIGYVDPDFAIRNSQTLRDLINSGRVNPTILSNPNMLTFGDTACFPTNLSPWGIWGVTSDYSPSRAYLGMSHENGHLIQASFGATMRDGTMLGSLWFSEGFAENFVVSTERDSALNIGNIKVSRRYLGQTWPCQISPLSSLAPAGAFDERDTDKYTLSTFAVMALCNFAGRNDLLPALEICYLMGVVKYSFDNAMMRVIGKNGSQFEEWFDTVWIPQNIDSIQNNL